MILSAHRLSIAAAAFLVCALAMALPGGAAAAAAKTRIALPINPSVALIPAYIARDKGLFEAEGLDAEFVPMTAKTMVTAGIRGTIDFVPNTRDGAQAVLKGAKLIYVVGGATISRWAVVAEPGITSPEALRGRILAQGHVDSPGFGEGAQVLDKFFGLRLGRQYKGMSFPSEQKRLAALSDGTVQAALLSFPYAAKARAEGFGLLFRTGAYLPRLDGAFWTSRANLKKKRAETAAFIRAIARAIDYLRTDAAGSTEIIRRAFEIREVREARFLWDMTHDAFSADMPDAPFHALFEDRRQDLISRGLWPKGKKLPDVERFAAHRLLMTTLRGMGYRLASPPDLTHAPN